MLISVFPVLQMEYPPAWDYIPVGEMHTASFRGVDKAVGLTVYLEVTGQAAGAFRITLGGGEILEARIDGTSILGESFKGKTIPKSQIRIKTIKQHSLDPDPHGPVTTA